MVYVIIPAFNEEESIGNVVRDIPSDLVQHVIVVNNASTDLTQLHAEKAGAIVVKEEKRGYGNACLKGIEYINSMGHKPDVVVFMDADYSDYPEEMRGLCIPIFEEGMDMVIGSRALGNREKGAMTVPQVFGNWLATNLLKVFYGVKYTDLGPFRAIRWDSLLVMKMEDKTFGWTVEMQLKAAKLGMKTTEVAVNYRKRIGFSKISGTVKGTILAGYKIIWTIFKYL